MAGGSGKPSSGQTAQLVSLGTMLFACVAVGLGIAAAGVNFYRIIKALNGMDQSDGSS